MLKPDYIFETSWEVCNKVGGIYTVISTKAPLLAAEFKNNYILIGPDVWKETHENPEFSEDTELFRTWRLNAQHDGMHFRIGRWEIPGRPVAILVDFTPYFHEKDKIFAWLWEKYRVDSLTGQWDYIEPALFGYAAAKVIESFYDFHLSAQDKIVAQFHEWMTGSGVLYLKDKVPQVGTIFTTHATILGRSIAGNGMLLYRDAEKFNPDELARKFGILSKFSLEKTSAVQADCFATVSEITGRECHLFLGKDPDVITPNGFDDSFVPQAQEFNIVRKKAREKLLNVAEALLGYKLSKDPLLVINSGRYEFRNKGIGLFIEALGNIREDKNEDHEIVAFITVPAHHTGADKHLLEVLEGKEKPHEEKENYTTHNLFDHDHDPVIRDFRQNNLLNKKEDKVKVIFVPAYLEVGDGIFDMQYYDLLTGFDVSVFPSYYEPWGYTPLESAAFSIPTVTTSLAGFGRWVRDKYKKEQQGVVVIERDDENDLEVVAAITEYLRSYNHLSRKEQGMIRKQAFEVSRIALWQNLLEHYRLAFSNALVQAEERSELFFDKRQSNQYFLKDISKEHKPVWKKIFIQPVISGKLIKLVELSGNLWWTWNCRAEALFRRIDPERWDAMGHNPVSLLETLSMNRIKELEKDTVFIADMQEIHAEFKDYLAKASEKPAEKIAYFTMEYGLHESIRIYSGGLGILAGDYLKQASDSNKNMVGVGLLYRYGFFQQSISIFGDQTASYLPQKFTRLPLHPVRNEQGEWVKVSIALPGRNLNAKVYRLDVGRIPLYLLDTDISDNMPDDRGITHKLYGGDWENRFKQELLLGVGGIRLLKELKIEAGVYHLNEGHAAFTGLERLRNLVQDEGLTYDQAVEVVRSSSLFTTHTPVPAGHDAFEEDILRTYIPHYPERLNITWERFMSLGKFNESAPNEKFSMSVLAAKLSQEINGVSKIHGRVSRDMLNGLFSGYFPEELHIGHVTNGVHYPTWASWKWQQLFIKLAGKQFMDHQSDPKYWKVIEKATDQTIWELRNHLREKLIDYLRVKLKEDLTRRQESPKIILQTIELLDPTRLTIGFARRFATYKRAHLLFNDLDRLKALVNNEEYPIQFIFSGKAHPEDKAGQGLIKKIIEISKHPDFIGKVVFVENYNMELARVLVQGVDIWLNTPTRPKEASGTSGEKALMNGVLNLSVLDGWWAEGYKPGAGWAIQEARTYANQNFQDELDAELIYYFLENEILPKFYSRTKNVPVEWINIIRKSLSEIAPDFTMKRMLDDYYSKFYNKLFERSARIRENNYDLARELNSWKSKVRHAWDGVKVVRMVVPDATIRPFQLGDDFVAEIELDLNGLSGNDLIVDIVFGQKEQDEVREVVYQEELKLTHADDRKAVYHCRIPATRVGVYDYAFRLIPSHPALPHRQDFELFRWL